MGFSRQEYWSRLPLPSPKCEVAAAAKSLQLCPTPCDPRDGSTAGSPVPGILQARTLEWVAISFANAWKWKVKVKSLSRVQLLATPCTAAYQAPPSMGFSRQEYWSGVPLPLQSKSLHTIMLERVWRKQNPLTLLAGIQTSMVTMGNGVEIPYKTGNRIAIWPCNPTARHAHWGNQNWKRHVYPSVHRSTLYNSTPGHGNNLDDHQQMNG